MSEESSNSLIHWPTAAYIVPFVMFMLVSSWNPDFSEIYSTGSPETEVAPASTPSATWWYFVLVALQVVIGSSLLIAFRRFYLADFPLRVSWLAVPTGILGVVLWIALCELGYESTLLGWLGMDVARPAFNPFTIDEPIARGAFFVCRFTLLAVLVPIIEELFLRGWLVRWIENPDFESVSLSGLGTMALLSASLYGVLTHPGEAIAAFVWFGLVTLLMKYTGNLWDCVIAHAVTNLLLGIYVVMYQQWQLW